MMALAEAGKTLLGSGDVASHLRDGGYPMPTWHIRGEFSNLEAMGLIRLDAKSARWHIVEGASFSIDAANAARQTP